jgi:hypothetical protein
VDFCGIFGGLVMGHTLGGEMKRLILTLLCVGLLLTPVSASATLKKVLWQSDTITVLSLQNEMDDNVRYKLTLKDSSNPSDKITFTKQGNDVLMELVPATVLTTTNHMIKGRYRFDKLPAMSYTLVVDPDKQGIVIPPDIAKVWTSGMLKYRRLLIEVPVFMNDNTILRFDLEGFHEMYFRFLNTK